jgi:hypothetical protein
MLSFLNNRVATSARQVLSRIGSLDPRIVQLRDPTTNSHRTIAATILSAVLAISAVSVAATRDEATPKRPSDPPQPSRPKPERQIITNTAIEIPTAFIEEQIVANAVKTAVPKRHPRFFDPVYVFSGTEVHNVSAYPLANPPGIVVDLEGTPEPTDSAHEHVGKDDRILSVRRRVTNRGLRYILKVSTPIKRLEVVHEGNVTMIFPAS